MTCLELSAERIKRFINQGCETGANRSSTNRPEEHEKRDWGKYWGTVRRALCPLPERSTAPQHPNGGLNAAQRKEGLGSNPRDFSVTLGSNPSVFLIRLTLSSWTDFSKSSVYLPEEKPMPSTPCSGWLYFLGSLCQHYHPISTHSSTAKLSTCPNRRTERRRRYKPGLAPRARKKCIQGNVRESTRAKIRHKMPLPAEGIFSFQTCLTASDHILSLNQPVMSCKRHQLPWEGSDSRERAVLTLCPRPEQRQKGCKHPYEGEWQPRGTESPAAPVRGGTPLYWGTPRGQLWRGHGGTLAGGNRHQWQRWRWCRWMARSWAWQTNPKEGWKRVE